MAAPTVRARTAPAAGLSATSPASTEIGDAVIVFTWEQTGAGIPTHTLQSGFVELRTHGHDDGSTDGRLSAAYRIATSAGANSYQAYTSSVGTTVRTGIIVLQVGTHSLGVTNTGTIATNSATQTNNAVPNPPSVNLGATRDWLVVPIAGWHLGSAATVTPTAPTNYTNLQHVAGSSASEVASSERGLTAPASEDPGTYGDDVTPNGSAIITLGLPNPVERSAAVGATADIATSGTFWSTLERAAVVGATADIATSGEVDPALTEHERSASLAASAAVSVSGEFFSIFERAAAVGASATLATSATFFTIFERAAEVSATAGSSTIGEFFSVFAATASVGAEAAIATSGHRSLERAVSVGALAGIVSAGGVPVISTSACTFGGPTAEGEWV